MIFSLYVGIPWTEEEHKKFLLGLHKLGRGNWRGISRNYVRSRTPTQVASHAQKYFIRQSNAAGKKKRPSLFDLAPDMVSHATLFLCHSCRFEIKFICWLSLVHDILPF